MDAMSAQVHEAMGTYPYELVFGQKRRSIRNTVPSTPKNWFILEETLQKEGVICEAWSISCKPDYDVISERKEDSSKNREKRDMVEDKEEECCNMERNEDGNDNEAELIEKEEESGSKERWGWE